MNYRQDKYGNNISILGFGCMRFQRKAGKIDMEKAEKQIMTAIENGVNYFDTAYIYPGSEAALGEILQKNNARDKGIPVMIMEPLRGGKLVKALPAEAKRIFDEYEIKRTPAQWAFRWLWNQKEVTCVLSGMNTDEMVQDNIKTASAVKIGEFTAEQEQMLKKVAAAINKNMKVGCTGCGYCMPCPKTVDIPGTFSAYNRLYSEGKFAALREYFMCTAFRKNSSAASNCIECGKCEIHCPQGINIRAELKNAQKELEVPIYRIARRLAKIFVKF